jgi:ABC-type oligopeptide transport system substrate-binding subunit
MKIRTLALGAAVLTAVSLTACSKPADQTTTDSTPAANATQTTDSLKPDSAAVKPSTDSVKPMADSAKPVITDSAKKGAAAPAPVKP